MTRLLASLLTTTLLACPAYADHHEASAHQGSTEKGSSSKTNPDGWTRLLSKDLSEHWELWFGVPHKTVTVPGYPPSASEDGTTGKPIGLVDVNNDPLGLLTMTEEDGGPVLHISGQIYAGLTTKKVYKDYHLSVQMKWGEKKWPPRQNMKRDSGLLLHCTGPHGAFWNVWMACQECQIQEADFGDWIPLAGTHGKVRVDKPGPGARFDLKSDQTVERGYISHNDAAKEKPNGEWNTLEVYALGDDLVFLVNGTPNMAVLDSKFRGERLAEGKIQLQSEAAEVFYRDLKIRPITQFPPELAEYVRPVE